MKTNIFFIYLTIGLSFLLVMMSCSDKEGFAEAPNFDSGPFNVKSLGVDSLLFSKNSVNWSFLSLSVNNSALSLNDSTLQLKTKMSSSGVTSVYQIKGDWFTLEKLDNMRINVTIEENKAKGRSLDFTIHNGNGFRKISFVQAGH